MAIDFTCPHCGHQTSASEEYAGSSGPCANCGAMVTLPGEKSRFAESASTSKPAPAKRSGGMSTLFIVLGVLAAGGLVCCGGVALLLPAVETARESARRAQCDNNLKQIGIALHMYHEAHRSFPPAFITDENGKPMHSWRVLILPYMEQAGLHNQYDFDEPWDGPNNRQLMERCPSVFRCPSDPGDPSSTLYQVVVGPGTGWKANAGTKIQDITDGTSRSIAVFEADGPGRNWLDPTALTLDEVLPAAEKTPGREADPRHPHPGGRQIMFFDASTRFLSESIDPKVLRQLLLINDGEVINGGF
ncbi:DUF1559 domain-containing protein [Lignipirellula cremea]|uniref:DUF1559 domain-containing protein n=1 Tax=Lignipirellula cremea TaxID=2528010 RepID=A0A518DU20_9BACT|nr:DUF1559 domain-containing protein [Lignipirellula cremea]QDU95331.1 hypothetical protein Pla8534_31460 [Lignipirellula cremea]